jgi:hypothetical protein
VSVPVLMANRIRPLPAGQTMCPVAERMAMPDDDGVIYFESRALEPTVVMVEPESTNSAMSYFRRDTVCAVSGLSSK